MSSSPFCQILECDWFERRDPLWCSWWAYPPVTRATRVQLPVGELLVFIFVGLVFICFLFGNSELSRWCTCLFLKEGMNEGRVYCNCVLMEERKKDYINATKKVVGQQMFWDLHCRIYFTRSTPDSEFIFRVQQHSGWQKSLNSENEQHWVIIIICCLHSTLCRQSANCDMSLYCTPRSREQRHVQTWPDLHSFCNLAETVAYTFISVKMNIVYKIRNSLWLAFLLLWWP